MPERTIKLVFYTALDGQLHPRGAKADLSDEDAARYDRLLADSQPTSLAGIDNSPRQGGVNTPQGSGPGTQAGGEDLDGLTPSEMTDEQIDGLSGQALDDAIEMAGIDASQGGSLSNGGLNADEKRAALKAKNAEAPTE
jgi:hypothetical protein